MSDPDTTPQPRRSQRDRKQTDRLGQDDSPLKRKRGDDDEGDALSDPDVDEDVEMADAEDEGGPEYKAKAALKTKVPKDKPKASPVKKPRANPPKKRGPRKVKGEVDVAKLTKESNIADDNPLFNAIINPATALQTTIEDFMESFSQTPALALADLITCILRCCGCNDSVDSDQVMDYDGVVDTLDTFTEELKREDSPVYPLTSKLPVFKPFRKSLAEFLSRLVKGAADAGILHDSNLIPTLQAWVIPMSSSVIRSFRHTATVIALEAQTALCEVAAAVDSELEVLQRQREGERKKKSKTPGRDKELDKKTTEAKTRRSKVTEFIKEIFDGVFVHRYRDLDPLIRSDCVQALGKWLTTHSSYFLEGSYLRYIGWVLSDSVSSVRLASIKALAALYAKKDFAMSLGHFTDRFKGRLVEMATRDIDIGIRVATIGVLSNIEQLEEEEKNKICLMIFDEESRLRKAVSPFVQSIWDEAVEDRLVGHVRDEITTERVGIKCLAELLVKWSKALEREQEEIETSSQSQIDSWQHAKEVSWLVSGNVTEGRIAKVVEALTDSVDVLSDWKPLLNDLLLDHSAVTGNGAPAKKGGRKGKAVAAAETDVVVEDYWRLDDAEEGVMLEVLLAVLQKASGAAQPAVAKKTKEKDADDSSATELTRALIKSLPRLISKHQTDEGRISVVLLMPQVMNLDLYLEMRMVSSYEALWDDVIRQFFTHSSVPTVVHSVATMMHMLAATALSTTNTAKMTELEEELAISLRDAVDGKDDLEIATFSEDETRTLATVCTRISLLGKSRDMTKWIEEAEGGKQSSAWTIISALLERGVLGYEQEEKMIVDCMDILAMHVIWTIGLYKPSTSEADALYLDNLISKRNWLLEKITAYVVPSGTNTRDEIKRTAFQHVLNIYGLCRPPHDPEETEASDFDNLHITMAERVQYNLAGFVQYEVERYAEELVEQHGALLEPSDAEPSDEEEATQASKKKGKGAARSQEKQSQLPEKSTPTSTLRVQLEKEFVINSLTSSFLRAIRLQVISVRHTGILLAYYGRLDPTFDTCIKTIVDILREEGMLKEKGEVVVAVALQGLRESFTFFLDGAEQDESHTAALAKLLASCFFVRGAQLAIVRKLESRFLISLHTTAIGWIVKKVAGYQGSEDTKGRNKALLFFKSLAIMAASLNNNDTLQIKAHLDQTVATAKLEVGSAKAWDPYRSYERKLTPGASKAKVSGKKVKAKKQANGAAAPSDDEVENLISASENEGGDLPPSQRRAAAPKPRPRPRPKPRAKAHESEKENENENEGGTRQETEQEKTPRPKRPNATYSRSPKKPHVNGTSHSDEELSGGDQRQEEEPAEDVAADVGKDGPDPDVPNFKSKRKRIRI